MNISRLNQKMRLIMGAHDIVNKDSLEAIKNTKIAISEDYLYHNIIQWNIAQLEYTTVIRNLREFKALLQSYNITPLIVLCTKNTQPLDSQIVLETLMQQNKSQFRELLYVDSFIEAVLPKRCFLKYLQDLNYEYMVVNSVGAQLRYLYTNNIVHGILSEISFLQHCHGFKELNHLMLRIIGDGFEWVDIKLLTAKSQLGLDSLSEIYGLWDYCSRKDSYNCFTEAITNQTALNKFEQSFDQITFRQKTDIFYNISQQIFSGKFPSLEARFLKFQHQIQESQAIIQFIKSQREGPTLDLNGDYILKDGIQYPTEINILQCHGIGLVRMHTVIKDSIEIQELQLQSAQALVLEKLNLSYLSGRNIRLPSMTKQFFKDYTPDPTMCRALSFYYKKLKLTSRKSSYEEQEPPQQISVETIQLNVNLRFLHYFKFIDMSHEKGSLFASALFRVRPQYFDLAFTYLFLMESPMQHLLFSQFYDYYLENDHIQLHKLLVDNQKEINKIKYQAIPLQEHQQISQNEIVLLRVFTLCNTRQVSEFNQFSELLNCITNHQAEVYDYILMALNLEMSQRSLMDSFIAVGHLNPFNRQFRYQKELLMFLQKKMSVSEFRRLYELDYMVECWRELMNLFQYIQEKQGTKFVQLFQANDYLEQLLQQQ